MTIWVDTPYGSYPFHCWPGTRRFFATRGGQIRVPAHRAHELDDQATTSGGATTQETDV